MSMLAGTSRHGTSDLAIEDRMWSWKRGGREFGEGNLDN
jgi:hypothetical protein